MKFFFFVKELLASFTLPVQQNETADIKNQFYVYSNFIKTKKFKQAIDKYASEDILNLIPKHLFIAIAKYGTNFQFPRKQFIVYDLQSINFNFQELYINN